MLYTRSQRDVIIDMMSVCYYIATGQQVDDDCRIPDELREQLLKRLPAAEWVIVGEICEDWLDQH